ncbi:Serine/arginine-rich splicing factor RS2Z32 [Mizuhopecten yessoensis]|uniref:Serine/arginine-rich splicing factor RS2Z32 n=1 Tax=Mizuhopecten yessoensis TaxID=6573 RepID=A0A210PFW5_MIZYE|nr:Serine/arginine-rich splicing factor RS2Z32 [Mizuhopecten yessoensis]
MSRREGQLFVGRLSKSTRVRDLEDVFEAYGRLARCEVKYGAEMAYAFVDFEDRRDAEDAIKYENGREISGSGIVVEWAKGNRRGGTVSRGQGFDDCYRCHRSGHWARDCPDDRNYGFRRRGPGVTPEIGIGGRGKGQGHVQGAGVAVTTVEEGLGHSVETERGAVVVGVILGAGQSPNHAVAQKARVNLSPPNLGVVLAVQVQQQLMEKTRVIVQHPDHQPGLIQAHLNDILE